MIVFESATKNKFVIGVSVTMVPLKKIRIHNKDFSPIIRINYSFLETPPLVAYEHIVIQIKHITDMIY